MRILHISTRLIIGGSQENTILSCQGQADRGHDVALAFGPIFGPEGSMLDRIRGYPGVETFEVRHLVRDIAPVTDARGYFELRSLIRTWMPDVVHSHSSKAGILGRLAAWREGVPTVVHTIHGLPFHPYQAKWRNAAYVFAERLAAKRCHSIVCVADAMRDQALAAGVGQPSQYTTVYSGMDLSPYLRPTETRERVRADLGFDTSDIVFVTVSRLAELKGHDDLLDALGPIIRRHPRVKMLWVGDGWWRERLEARIAELGLGENVRLAGLVLPEEVPRYLLAGDVVIHPSYREGLPRAVTQGYLSGRPAIAYDVDGTGEVCIDGDTGLLVTPGDLEGLARAALWMIDNFDDRLAMGERGKTLCMGRFSAEAMVDALEAVYAAS